MTRATAAPALGEQANGPAARRVRLPRLVSLELHGYKSFAHRVELVFPPGITAIVGPNGSGKSNIVDALRWVLGEQSYSLLRGKRTEDMIFHGSDQRPRMGMASVTVTFENSDGWLGVDFAQVVIARRAYRSGENEYFLNGNRVRLRDIQDLLAPSGLLKRSYAIVGQGLVDQALSQRPEERRVLIEEAAGIAGYQRKRDQALTRLAEVQANLTRVRDIMAELAPQVRRLQRQAERVERYRQIEATLRERLLTWYGFRWHQALQAFERARENLRTQEQRVTAAQEVLRELEDRRGSLEAEIAALRERVEAYHRQVADLHRELETILRQEAVLAERQRSLEQQREEILTELPTLERHLEALCERRHATEEALQALASELATLQTALQEAEAALASVEAERQELERAASAAQEAVLTQAALVAELAEQERQVAQRLQLLAEEKQRLQERRKAAEQQLAAHEAELAAGRERWRKHRAMLVAMESAIEEKAAMLAARREALHAANEVLRGAEARLQSLRERYAALERQREEGQGLYRGVQAVLRAQHLDGVVGLVSQVIRVPADLERAIAEALGAALQDVVVRRWEDAQRAIEYLRRERLGRATFIPLDTVRAAERVPAPKGDGVIGLAADLVEAEETVRPVVEMLLNRTLVVRDLDAARRVLARASGLRIVTLNGEVVRTTGRVTGGDSNQHYGDLLAREREWRELPDKIAQAEAAVASAREEVATLEREVATVREELEALRSRYASAQARGRALQSALEAMERQHATLRARLEAIEAEAMRLQEEARRLEERHRALTEQRTQAEAAKQQAEATWQATQRALAEKDPQDILERVAHLQAQLATLNGRRIALHQTVETLSQDIQQQNAVVEARRATLKRLEEELASLETELAGIRERAAAVRQQLRDLEAPAREAQERLNALKAAAERLLSELEQQRQRVHEEERRRAELALSLDRAQDALVRIRESMEADLGPVTLSMPEGFPVQAPLPLEETGLTLPCVTELPHGLEEEIAELRRQLRALEPINPEAPAEYARLQERYRFLENQVQDLEEASANLKRMLAELERVMQREFQRTFDAVAHEFQRYFRRLFGGGDAQLVLLNGTDPNSAGLEIVARPPGKRTHGLDMLSGGERSLTAAALIFAILRVSPPPFCVLDEVDAALDEANVVRFREALRELAQDLQFVVITHNRGTIEVADTIYGVAMGKDGVSRVLSLRLEEVPHFHQPARAG